MFQLTPAVWIIAGLILAVLEMIVPGMVIIWFGIAGVVTGILAIFVHDSYVQFGVFIVLSGLMVVFSQRIARKITSPEPEAVGANRMQGATGVVLQDIGPNHVGRVKVGSDEWRGEAQVVVAKGTIVRVVRVEGTRVIVEPTEGSKK